MTSAYLDDSDTLVRHLPASKWFMHPQGPQVFPQAFELRANEEYLSAQWLEFCDGNLKAQIIQLADFLSNSNRPVKNSHAFALGKVRTVRAACISKGQKTRIVHEPFALNPAYCAVRQINTGDQSLLDLLASEAWAQVVPFADCHT